MQLVKYMGCWVLSFSWTSAELTAFAEAIMYIIRGREGSSLAKTGGVVRSCFKVLKFCSQVSSQANLVDFFRSWIIALVLSANFKRKHEMAVSLPTSRCTSLIFAGLLISMMVWHFSGLASIPHCVSMKPRNFPPSTPNVHFSGSSLMLYVRKALKTSVRSAECCLSFGDLTMMSSTYTSTDLPRSGWNTLSIKRWYVASSFLRPQGMTL